MTHASQTSHTIRLLTVDDADAWAHARLEALTAHPLMFGATPPGSASELLGMFRERVTQHESVIVGALRDSQLDGVVGVVRQPGLKERHKAVVWGVYVAPSTRSRGLGHALLNAAITHARSWPGLEQLHLSVSEVPEHARPLYERVGFVAWGREPRALVWNGISVDETHMVLDLRRSTAESQT
jgi:GNAT superfamily N-acetyltransferase